VSELFVFFLNKSITAGWIVAVVLILRPLLRRAPRWVTCSLWGVVGLRLLLPFSLTSVFSLIPSATPVPEDIALTHRPAVQTGVDSINTAVNPLIYEAFAPPLGNSVNPLQVVLAVAAWVWIVGVFAMLVYAAAAYIRLARRVRVSLPLGEGVYACDTVVTPFILGILKPRIFLPSAMAEDTAALVIAHEKAHLKRRDHWIKPLSFLLLSVYWFHPLVWVGYLFLCRDIEAACDEKVVKTLDIEGRCAYSTALVECNPHRRAVALCPLAFGEVGVKARVKAVLNYKKPSFWLILLSVVVSVAVAVCFLTDPRDKRTDGVVSQHGGSDLKGVSLIITEAELSAPDPYFTVEWNNDTAGEILYGEPFDVYYKQDGGWVDCRQDDAVWTMPAYNVRPHGAREKTYRLRGLSMYIAGEYRLEASFTANGEKHTAWVEFTLARGVEQEAALNFEPQSLWYVNGAYSYVMTADKAPRWGLVNGTALYEYGRDGLVAMLGYMQKITLNEDTFFSRLKYASGWEENTPSVDSIYKNNKYAWQLYNGNTLYLLLEQQDGRFLMGYGSYNHNFDESPNPDNSEIRWLYQLEKTEKTPNMSQPIVDGAIVFYRETTEEHNTPVYDTYHRMSSAALTALMDDLAAEQWIYDGLVDRTAFHFDGKLWYHDQWLYFGFEERIVFCGEHFAGVSDDTMERFKSVQKQAEPFRGQ